MPALFEAPPGPGRTATIRPLESGHRAPSGILYSVDSVGAGLTSSRARGELTSTATTRRSSMGAAGTAGPAPTRLMEASLGESGTAITPSERASRADGT